MKNDGGPAFPVTFEHSYGVDCGTKSQEWQGMALRDFFAAAALQGLLACPTSGEGTRNDWAKWSYEYADSMLAERARSLTSKE